MEPVPIGGRCDPAFEAVREAFARNFVEEGEVGAAVTVVVNGEEVVDLHGGWADEACTQPWAADTIVDFYSVGKALVALLALQLVDQGRLVLDDPVASVWPEFAAGGKETVTIRQAFSHQGTVPAIRELLPNEALWDWNRMCSAIAASEAWWEPGTRHAYHTNTYGHLLGELIHRVTGELPGTRLRRLAADLDADVWFGLPPEEQVRCAELIWAPGDISGWFDLDTLEGDALMEAMSYVNPRGIASMGIVNTPEWRATQVPSTNGHGTASGVARIYAALLEPDRLLSPVLLAEATRPQSSGPCPILHDEMSFGLGFQPTTPHRPFGPNPGSYGHFGTGGSLGMADPSTGVAVGYVMNHVKPRWQSTRNRALLAAVYASL